MLSPPSACPFCDEFLGDPDAVFFRLTGGSIRSRILHETEHFAVFPPLGEFVEGGLLLATRGHVMSMAHVAPGDYAELERLMEETSELLCGHYGCRPLLFEHSPVGAGDKGTCCVDHAHLNVFPVAVDVHRHLARLPHVEIARMSELGEPPHCDRPYLFLQTNDGRRFVYDAGVVPSQYVRQIVTAQLGIPERWHWRDYLGLKELKRTLARLAGWRRDESRESRVESRELRVESRESRDESGEQNTSSSLSTLDSGLPTPSRPADYEEMRLDVVRSRWDAKAPRWDQDLADPSCHLHEDDGYRRFLEVAASIIAERAELCRQRLLVDLACGTGLVLAHLIESFAEGLGIDLSPGMVEVARRKAIPRARFEVGNAFELSELVKEWGQAPRPAPISQGSCTSARSQSPFFHKRSRVVGKAGAIVSRGVLLSHYGPRWAPVLLREIHRSLASDGFAVLDFLNAAARDRYASSPENKSYFDGGVMERMGLEAGFRRCRCIGEPERRSLVVLLE